MNKFIKDLKTIPLTVHVPLNNVPKLISKNLIELTISIAKESLISLFNISKPRIIITGLNPHAGENGDIGDEEKKIIIPAINEAKKKQNCFLEGPISADTAFSSEKRRFYDVAICMYHDQALIPIKTLDFFNGVNVTLGLDFIRTSPDHGTGFDIAGKNIANPIATILSLSMALRYSLDLDKEADLLELAVQKVLDDGLRTKDIMSSGKKEVTTTVMGDAIISKLK